MKRFLFLLFLPLLSLSFCSKNVIDEDQEPTPLTSIYQPRVFDYDDIHDKMILWNECFDIDLNQYFVYFFSRTCGHCLMIKSEMIETILINDNYFACEEANDHAICSSHKNINLGQENFCILGYPTIIEIENKKVVDYASGQDEVLEFILIKNSL